MLLPMNRGSACDLKVNLNVTVNVIIKPGSSTFNKDVWRLCCVVAFAFACMLVAFAVQVRNLVYVIYHHLLHHHQKSHHH